MKLGLPGISRRLLVLSALAAGAFVSLAEGEASAFEKQHHLGLAPGLAILNVKDKSTASVGSGLALHYAYGLTDQWNFMVEGGSHVVALDQGQDTRETPRTRPGRVDHAGVGLGYVLDVLRWVPYFGLLGQTYVVSGGTVESSKVIVGVALAAGLDYQVGRHLAVGFAFRQSFMVSELSTYPSYTLLQLRAEYVWGY